MPWIQDVMEATKRAESPRSFMLWSALAAISAVVNNKVYLDKRIYKLYPNIYVILVAKSGMRKGFPVQVAKKLVTDIGNTRVIAGRSSIQSVVQSLGKTVTVPKAGGGINILKDATAFINAGEMSTSLVRDPDALTILTDLHDGHYNPEWTNTLKSTGKEVLKNVCITLLGAMNQTHFNDMITAKEISGGFIARCVLVLEEKRAHKDALLRPELNDEIDYEGLEKYLMKLADIKGQFKLTDEAINTYEEWYNDFEPETMDDRTGTANRIHDQILKVAMLLSLSNGDDLLINDKNIKDSMALCLESTASINRITAGSGIHVDAPKIKLVIQYLLSRPGFSATRGDLLRKHHGSIDRFDLDRIVDTLLEMQGLTAEGNGTETIYTLTERATQGLKSWRQA